MSIFKRTPKPRPAEHVSEETLARWAEEDRRFETIKAQQWIDAHFPLPRRTITVTIDVDTTSFETAVKTLIAAGEKIGASGWKSAATPIGSSS